MYQAQRVGFNADIVTNSRKINNSMAEYIAQKIIMKMALANIPIKDSRVIIMGAVFKENTDDLRNSKVADIYFCLKQYGISPVIVDPRANNDAVMVEFGIPLTPMAEVQDADCIVFAVAHDEFFRISKSQLNGMYKKTPAQHPVLIDVKRIFNKSEMENLGYIYWGL
jgi:UDP-N-acetyl-D-galactosamine dehydrogenase